MINAVGIPVMYTYETPGERNDALMKAAYIYNVRAFSYCISDIPSFVQTGKIPAVYWNGSEYTHCETDLPRFTEIYSSVSKMFSAFPSEMAWLKANTVFTDDVGLTKLELQSKMQKSELMPYSIPTILIRAFKELVASVNLFSSSFLKPIGGRKAHGVMKITRKATELCYHTPESSGVLTEEVYNQYYNVGTPQEPNALLLEPCLNILNDDGRAVDFRCLVSLNGEGKWQNVLTYARIGGSDVASNFSHGGSLNFAEEVLEALIPGHGAEKLREINEIALKVAAFVQGESPNTVSWLGLDICVDRPSNQIYVIEANSKPGTKLVGPWPLALVRAQYFRFLLSQEEK